MEKYGVLLGLARCPFHTINLLGTNSRVMFAQISLNLGKSQLVVGNSKGIMPVSKGKWHGVTWRKAQQGGYFWESNLIKRGQGMYIWTGGGLRSSWAIIFKALNLRARGFIGKAVPFMLTDTERRYVFSRLGVAGFKKGPNIYPQA